MVDRIEATIKIFLDFLASEVHMHTMTKINDLSAVENCVCFHLRRATRAVTQFYDAEMRRHGIRPSQVSIFSALNSRDSWSMSDLSDLLGMDRTTLVRNLGPLQRDGFVQTDGGGKGSRVELSLTKKGRKQIEKFMPAWESAQSAAVHVLGEKRWSALLADLDTVVSALKSSETDS
jgi:DNA-binding MarR family transcriptional regulator